MFEEQNTEPISSRIINGSLITPPLGQANRINPLNQEGGQSSKVEVKQSKKHKNCLPNFGRQSLK